jgi:hypothetical protein
MNHLLKDIPTTTPATIQIVNASCFSIPWPVDAANARPRKQPVNDGPIQVVISFKPVMTQTMALTADNPSRSRDVVGELEFI